MNFLNLIQHLLPNAKAWNLNIKKNLKDFFTGLIGTFEDLKLFIDNVFFDIFPNTTRSIDLWEKQFGLVNNVNLTEQDRRNRLNAAWKALGGQSPKYIQDTLQENGFPVFVHEWWVIFPAQDQLALSGDVNSVSGNVTTVSSTAFIEDVVLPRNPFLVLGNASQIPSVDCGEDFAECGEIEAECGNTFPNKGFLLVNEIDNDNYFIPNDSEKWKYILYIGGEIYGDIVQIPLSRKNEFEELCLKICPTQQWLGLIIEYV